MNDFDSTFAFAFVFVAVMVLGVYSGIKLFSGITGRRKAQKEREVAKPTTSGFIGQFDVIVQRFVQGKEKWMPTTLMLHKHEYVVVSLKNVHLCHDDMEYDATGQRLEVRKGVFDRINWQSGGEYSELYSFDVGHLTLTNTRISFQGNRSSFDIDVKKINHVQPLDKGIGITPSGETRTLYFVWAPFNMYVTYSNHWYQIHYKPVVNESIPMMTWTLNGEEMRRIIQGVVSRAT